MSIWEKIKDGTFIIFFIFFSFGTFILSDDFIISNITKSHPNLVIFTFIPLMTIFFMLGIFILGDYQFSPNKWHKYFVEKFSITYKRSSSFSKFLFYLSLLNPFTAAIVIMINYRKDRFKLILYSLLYFIIYIFVYYYAKKIERGMTW